ncbi:hypothetical protein OJF2_02970 [Aquisphaera giovannonii]|uniref:Putative restriction endonuclease domain-containing protein n=1 Tax=Aquisphaera giovannonii TaxID=406548 RepID=A0A5B9VU30_9BACT|nr:Uma2 family endonuclease [Aquisphaera giovannonii]QEH31832.1 hypothetical protein OJF2_02970 [Aquisphaera giovannonii]
MSTISRPALVPEVVFPDSDGRPMADNTLQYKWIVIIKENLEILYQDRDDVFIAGDLLWYPDADNPKRCMAPDVLVAIGRPKGYRGSYRQWEEGGVAPQVVFEIHSPSNDPEEVMRKLGFYSRHGVEEYYYYDPETGKLTGFIRDERGLEDGIDMHGFTSPRLQIRFEPGDGPDAMEIFGPDGQRFLTTVELAQQRDEANRRAEAAEQKAEAERQKAEAERRKAEAAEQKAEAERRRAEAERQKAERLAAKLRELGIEPE